MNFKEIGEKLGLEEDEYHELIELFVESGTSDFQRLRDALDAGDVDQVLQSAHTLKGASSNLGLQDVRDLAKTIEQKARNQQMDNLAETVQALGTHLKHLESFVRG